MIIEKTYCGRPHSAHGGVAVGRFAALIEGPVEVRLLGPPPLDTPLLTRTEGDGTVVVSGPDNDVARVRSLSEPLSMAPFRRADGREVGDAASQYLADVAEDGHPFPTCFGCGPDRHDPEALRQFAALASDGDTIAGFRSHRDGPVPDWLTLAGLDCPSGISISVLAEEPPPVALLGAMQCQLHGRAQGGVDYQVRGRLVSIEGRKHTTEVAMLAPDGAAVASARAIWIAVEAADFAGITAEARP